MPDIPSVAPYESCIVCWKGDTKTAVAFEGEGEFVIAGLSKLGVPLDQATEVVSQHAVRELGCDYGQIPADDMKIVFRLCAKCASRAGVKVSRIPEAMTYRQPDEMRYDDE